MRRITLWLFSTVAALVLLFSYRTSTSGSGAAETAAVAPIGDGGTAGSNGTGSNGTGSTGNAGTGTTGAGEGSGDSGTATPAPTSGSNGGSGAGAAKTYTGSVAQTRWGPVQVSITVSGGKITDVAVPVYPSENGRDQEINARALPILRQETLEAQSATIDAVSGATVTSDGYLASLQSALDAAHLT